MRSSMTIAFICLIFSLSAQSRFSLGANVQLRSYSYDQLFLENNIFTLGGGLQLRYQLSQKAWIETGFVHQAGESENQGDNDLRWGTQHDGMGGFDPDRPGESLDVIIRQETFRIPLAVGYQIYERGNFSFAPTATLAYGNSRFERKLATLPDEEPTDFGLDFLTYGAGLNLAYSLGKVALEIRPEYLLQHTFSDSPTVLSEKSYAAKSFGGYVGIVLDL